MTLQRVLKSYVERKVLGNPKKTFFPNASCCNPQSPTWKEGDSVYNTSASLCREAFYAPSPNVSLKRSSSSAVCFSTARGDLAPSRTSFAFSTAAAPFFPFDLCPADRRSAFSFAFAFCSGVKAALGTGRAGASVVESRIRVTGPCVSGGRRRGVRVRRGR